MECGEGLSYEGNALPLMAPKKRDEVLQPKTVGESTRAAVTASKADASAAHEASMSRLSMSRV